MKNTHTLASMFESNIEVLEKELDGLILPKDAEKACFAAGSYYSCLAKQSLLCAPTAFGGRTGIAREEVH